MPTDLHALKAQIEALPIADRLRLAAGLLEKGPEHARTAEIVTEHALTELQGRRLFPGLYAKTGKDE